MNLSWMFRYFCQKRTKKKKSILYIDIKWTCLWLFNLQVL